MGGKVKNIVEANISISFSSFFWNLFSMFASYRAAMKIKEAVLFSGGSIYYCCPRCSITLDREFMSYCDRCGQKLDWTHYKKATVLAPVSKRKHCPGKDVPCQGILVSIIS